MTTEEIRQADKFVEEHVMYLYKGRYYAVDITEQEDGYYIGMDDYGNESCFTVEEIEAEFPHIIGA